MDITDAMMPTKSDQRTMEIVETAMRTAVDMGIFPSACFPEQYIENWNAMDAIVRVIVEEKQFDINGRFSL